MNPSEPKEAPVGPYYYIQVHSGQPNKVHRATLKIDVKIEKGATRA